MTTNKSALQEPLEITMPTLPSLETVREMSLMVPCGIDRVSDDQFMDRFRDPLGQVLEFVRCYYDQITRAALSRPEIPGLCEKCQGKGWHHYEGPHGETGDRVYCQCASKRGLSGKMAKAVFIEEMRLMVDPSVPEEMILFPDEATKQWFIELLKENDTLDNDCHEETLEIIELKKAAQSPQLPPDVVERVAEALDKSNAAMWDSHYGKGIEVAYAQSVDREVKQALTLLSPHRKVK
jgi:hypothetical protein